MVKKRKYRTCQYCGAHLDHGEKCECQKSKNRNLVEPIDKEKNTESMEGKK